MLHLIQTHSQSQDLQMQEVCFLEAVAFTVPFVALIQCCTLLRVVFRVVSFIFV